MESNESPSQATRTRRKRNAKGGQGIQYHGPYTDASRQRFFLPQKLINNRVQGVEYDFSEDLDGDKLMNNLSWLGREET